MALLIIFPFILMTTIIVHYIFLSRMGKIFETKWHQSTKLITVLCGLFIAHLIEIFIYAMVYQITSSLSDMAATQQANFASWLDSLYFSFLAYSSLGAGDLSVSQPFKILYGLEAINGLLLIAWSASFSLLAMNRVHFCEPCISDAKQR
ncbi:ion channel [Methylophaga sp.]|uniref:ion channel n=1 Tax=Methylophaga sp. TaxID=2024840 RepID=UPI0025D13754|nr:ion channel [Methylophaga sp.]